ncbi:PH-domain-containing protein [Melanomma pulvis-pyrius CBS 109.77]|uniref:PH-domain-containing protein n=1 Tax=Melanomma pulvis-pyrius CBS 109.77 TaxID=1314802 RepID=A0A6A6XFJ4_9PLEO|nr:PH-domain-containing protein [Melanomma pulvis-pyrius CBS 109.77]
MAANVHPTSTQPIPIRPTGMKITPPSDQSQVETLRSNHAGMGVMSPVNQNGSFEFDRVIKSGNVVKRTRKTKSWKPIYLVLRPNLLSIYKDKDETKLRHQINLSEITAVARQKDSKKKVDHVFGLFSPARNYHLSASTEKDAQEWVHLIRAEARIDEEDEEMICLSPTGKKTFTGLERALKREHVGSSSSEAEPRASISASPETNRIVRQPSHTLNYSGNEYGSFSDFSDTGGPIQAAFRESAASLPRTSQQNRNVSRASNVGSTPDDERVIYHGWLYVLKSKGGVRQWKKVWVVLRPKALGLYKNEEEYSANLIIPFTSIIDAVDIDPASKSRKHCMQVISEEKNFRFSAPGEESLARWLGAFKSLLVKRKEVGNQRGLQAVANSGNVQPPAPSKPNSSIAQQSLQKPAIPAATMQQQPPPRK